MFNKMFGGAKSKRTFKLSNVVNTDGCPTKFKPGRYTGDPQSAARKAFNVLCNHKNIKGKCMFYVSMQETTRGSGRKVMVADNNNKGKKAMLQKKVSHYKVERTKLPKPVVRFEGTENEYKILYKSVATSVKRFPPCRVKRARTTGPMKSKAKPRAGRKASKKRKSNASNKKMSNNNNNQMEMNNAYGNNQQKMGGGKRSKSKGRNLKNKRSLRKGRK